MATSQAAIQRFLAHRQPSAPPVKDMQPAELHALIKRITGIAYEPLTEPRPHQLAAQAFAAAQLNILLFIGLRGGKTKTILDRFRHLKRAGMARKGLVIVPNPVVRPVWVHEAGIHTPDIRVRTVANDPMDFVDAAEDPAADLVVASWSSLQNIFCHKQWDDKKQKNFMVEDRTAINFAAELFDFGAIDEMHGAKDHDSLRFNITKNLFSKTHSRIGCTGTPFGRVPFALWPQAFIIDQGKCLGSSYFFFKQAFGKQVKNWHSRSGFETVFDDSKISLLADKMQPLSLAYSMKECGVERVDPVVVKLKMTKEQEKHYRREATEFMKLEPGKKRENKFHTLRMISSGYVPYFDGNEGVSKIAALAGTPKLSYLEDLIEQDSGARCAIFYDYQETGKLICELLKKHKIKHTWLYGSTKDKAGAVSKFQQGAVDWIVINNQSGNAGIDLRRADYQCFFESPTSPIIRQQAEGRGLGQRSTKLYIDDLVCSKIEERILQFHAEGANYLEKIVFREDDIL